MRALHCDASDIVTKADWAQLNKALGDRGYLPPAVAELFYPKANGGAEYSEAEALGVEPGRPRRRHFLAGFGDSAYHEIYRRLCRDGLILFPDIEGLFRIKKEDGQVMKQVMRHVVSWVNPQPSEVSYQSESNKPLCREDLKPALRREIRHSGMREEDRESQVEAESKTLERLVLDTVQRSMDFFKSPATQAALKLFPTGDEEDRYAERFEEEPWEEILHYVQEVLGPRFRPPWRVAPRMDVGGGKMATSRITRSLGALASNIPEVAGNPALSSQEASEELCQVIDEAVGKWVARRCGAALEDARQTWSETALRTMKEAKGRHESYLSGDDGAVSRAADPLEEETQLAQRDKRKERGRPSRTPELGSSPGGLIGQGRAERRKASENNKDRVASVVGEPRPMAPQHELPISTNREAHCRSLGTTAKQLQPTRQSLQLRKAARQKLPPIANMLADLSGSNACGDAKQGTRRWEGLPVAR